MKGILEVLKGVGLSSEEARTYVALLELKEARTGELCAFNRLPSSKIYRVLYSLMQKGLASYRVQNNVKVFMPTSPDALNGLFLKKEEELARERGEVAGLVAKLKTRKIEHKPYSDYKYYEGIAGLRSMWDEITENTRNGMRSYAYAAKKGSYEKLTSSFDANRAKRRKEGVEQQILYGLNDRDTALRRMDRITDARLADLKNEAEWGVMGDIFYIQHMEGKVPRGFLIRDRVFAQSFADVFAKVWETSKAVRKGKK